MSDMSTQMEALDDFVAKARSHNGRFHEAQLGSLDAMATNFRESHVVIDGELNNVNQCVEKLQQDMETHTEDLQEMAAPLQEDVRQPLSELRENLNSHPMKEYLPTGATPQKRRYDYPSTLPRTESHDGLRTRHRTSKQFSALPFNDDAQPTPASSSPVSSPTKPSYVYSDAAEEVGIQPPPPSLSAPSNIGLREVDLNVAKSIAHHADDESELAHKPETPTLPLSVDLDSTPDHDEPEQPPQKRRRSASSNPPTESKLPPKMASRRMTGMMEGRENVRPSGIAGGRRFRPRNAE